MGKRGPQNGPLEGPRERLGTTRDRGRVDTKADALTEGARSGSREDHVPGGASRRRCGSQRESYRISRTPNKARGRPYIHPRYPTHVQGAASGPLNGVMHSFCGSPETATACLELGLYLSFSGMLTYKKNDQLRSLAATVPLDRLLVETDAPYLAPQAFRGKRNEPAWVAHTNACLAEIHGIEPEAMARQTTAIAHRLFFSREQP